MSQREEEEPVLPADYEGWFVREVSPTVVLVWDLRDQPGEDIPEGALVDPAQIYVEAGESWNGYSFQELLEKARKLAEATL